MDDFLKELKDMLSIKTEEEMKEEVRKAYNEKDEYYLYSMQLLHLKQRLGLANLPIENEAELNKFLNSYRVKEDENPPELLVKTQKFINKFLKDLFEFIKKEKELKS